MDKIRELDTFYRFIVALGFTAFTFLILLIVVFIGYCIFLLVDSIQRNKEKKKKDLLLLKICIDNLENELLKKKKK